ncbi:hypothetical protein [Bacillus paralicheniformis]|uniref:hypothetical protein n=1 Tax=Bacillus paralicheniformis TaxID=1648923 RepID=UPI000D034F44|nr:hypothetical protein [Bacillus paralicheniformis]
MKTVEEKKGRNMKRFKGVIGIGLIIFGLIFGINTYQHQAAGDTILRFLGLPAWSNNAESTGLHYSAILALIIVVAGFILAVSHYKEVPRIKLKLVLGSIAIAVLYPLFTEQSMFILKANAKGLEAVEYIKNKSICEYETMDDKLNIDCSVKINNYGKNTEDVYVYPSNDGRSDLKPEKLSLPPHSQNVYHISFYVSVDEGEAFIGEDGEPDIIIVQ